MPKKKSLIHNQDLLIRTGEDSKILDRMEEHGGEFVRSLARTMRIADGSNFKKLRDLFISYWEHYGSEKWEED